ncbi:hypothetical protein HDU82_007132 [Entophlyctis luteolus]|nr:hypothetical protein HDU82_007132 [Entophlyctis luteolus]
MSRDSCFGEIHHIIHRIKVASWNLEEDKVANDFVQTPIDDVDTIQIPRIVKKLQTPENSKLRNRISVDVNSGSAPLKSRIRELEAKLSGSELFQRYERQSKAESHRLARTTETVVATLHSRAVKKAASSTEFKERAGSPKLQESVKTKVHTEAFGWACGGSRAFWLAAIVFVFANVSIACVSIRTVRRLSGVISGMDGDGGN